MKTYVGEVKSYNIKELSEKAQEQAYSKWLSSGMEFMSASEIRGTLDEFCRLFDVKCRNWEYDSSNYNYRFTVEVDDEQDVLSGIRLAKFLWNNYAEYIQKGKYFSLWSKTEPNPYWKNEKSTCPQGKLKTRYSKVMKEMDNCPLTGVCYDQDVLDPIIKCLTYKKLYNSYTELIEECLDGLFSTAKTECEYAESFEYFVDEAEANDYEYDITGRAFYLPAGFNVA